MRLTKIGEKDDRILLQNETGEKGYFLFIDLLRRGEKEYAALADENGDLFVMEFIDGKTETYTEIADDGEFDAVCAAFAERNPEDFDY